MPVPRGVLAAALLLAAALILAFTWQSGIASISDDSVTYLTLARLFSGDHAPWASRLTWFPPLFPLLLAAVGGAQRFLNAHLLVAACAILALPLAYRHAACLLGRRDAALLVVVLFELTATAWVSIKSILAEPLFLLLAMGAVVFFEARMRADACARDRWLFGLLVAAAVLTRYAGVFLLAAYAAHVAMGWLAARRRPGMRDLVPMVATVLLVLAWRAVRPIAQSDGYDWAGESFLHSWLAHGAEVILPALEAAFQGWIASFTGDSGVPAITALVLSLVGLAALAGTAMRIARNAFDGWYVAITLAGVVLLFFGEDASRRYLYPVFPLLLVNAALALAALLRRFPERARRLLLGFAVAAPVLACLPAMALFAQKALDRRPVLEGFPIRYSDITEYYTVLDAPRARALAAKHAAVIAGLRAVGQVTPADARVMWMRPEYVSLLSGRTAVPWYFAWDGRTLARHIRDSRVDYFVLSSLYKADLAFARSDPGPLQRTVWRFAVPVLRVPNTVVGGDEFVLMRIDPQALSRFIESR